MVQPGRLDRVRVVQDSGRKKGSLASRNVLASDRDKSFPLQGALGHHLVQHLFVAPHNLVVEGTSDFTYLTVLADHLEGQGREGLDPRSSIVPVGGADMVPTFVALLGNHLEVTGFVDGRKCGHQRLDRLQCDGILEKSRIITVRQLQSRADGDIDDLFKPADYLDLYNRPFEATLKTNDLKGSDPIVNRLARHMGVPRFDHRRPAERLLRHCDQILSNLGRGSLDAFEAAFRAINETLPITAVLAAE